VDLIPAITKKAANPDSQMLLTRLFCLGFVACSFIFATQNIPIIVNLMSFSWGVVSGCFIGPYIWGLFSKKITKIGAFAGVLSGLITVGSATLVISLNSGFSAAAAKSPEMGVCAMAISLVVVPLVSAFTKNTETECHRVNAIFQCYDEEI
jgi:Na+/proline symporter